MSKKGRGEKIKFSSHFFLERSGRGHVVSGIRSTDIRVQVQMSDAAKEASLKAQEDTAAEGSIWRNEMDRIAELAVLTVRGLWAGREQE